MLIRPVLTLIILSGYDPDAYPPNYGAADRFVEENTLNVRKNERYWQEKAVQVQSLGKADDPAAAKAAAAATNQTAQIVAGGNNSVGVSLQAARHR